MARSRHRIPVRYNLRNVLVRKVSTGMTVLGIALVVAVFLLVMSLAEGVRKTFAPPVSSHTVMALRVGAQSDVMSLIARGEYEAVLTLPGIARGPGGEPLVSPEIVVLVNLVRKDGRKANVMLRGVESPAFLLRPELRVVEGRTFRAGTNEAIVARGAERRFTGLGVGSHIRSGIEEWIVVGVFDAGESPFGSEIWVDLHNLQGQSQREGVLSVVRLRAADRERQERLIASIKGNRQIKLAAKTEETYFSEQRGTAKPIEFLAWLVAAIMAIGASFGAMNTMYAQVSARTKDIATLRSLGFSRRAVLTSFVVESVFLALAGGALGAVAAWVAIHTIWSGPTGTQIVNTFSEVLFHFRLTPPLLARGLALSVAIGFVGGLLPAFRASRLKITQALRAA